MTPRNLHGQKYARDPFGKAGERQSDSNQEPPRKKPKTSVPKGSALASGYTDRAASRRDTEVPDVDVDDERKRLAALRDMLDTDQIDRATFNKLSYQIQGKDGKADSSTKGLDWTLLKRARRGSSGEEVEPTADVEAELDAALDHEPNLEQAIASERRDPDSSVVKDDATNAVLSRDDILRRWKQNRSGDSTQTQQPEVEELGDRFKKVINPKEKKRFVEIVDGRRREVLLTTGKDGKPKRKVRWLDKESKVDDSNPPPKQAQSKQPQPLGMNVPAELLAKQEALRAQQVAEEEEDDDIFADVGSTYDPLADIASSGDEGSNDEREAPEAPETLEKTVAGKRRNYFAAGSDEAAEEETDRSGATDPAIMAALKRAALLRVDEKSKETNEHAENANTHSVDDQRQKVLLEKLRQREADDSRDLDMGFGESRFGDDEEEVWTEDKKSGRKRGPKKRKGDKDNVSDVMGVLAGRQKA